MGTIFFATSSYFDVDTFMLWRLYYYTGLLLFCYMLSNFFTSPSISYSYAESRSFCYFFFFLFLRAQHFLDDLTRAAYQQRKPVYFSDFAPRGSEAYLIGGELSKFEPTSTNFKNLDIINLI